MTEVVLIRLFITKQFKEGKIYSGSQFQSTVLGSIDSGSMLRQNIMVTAGCSRTTHLMADRKQRGKGGDKFE
jgi:hypothetical protein